MDLRDFIRIVETASTEEKLPAWFLNGRPVDVLKASPDAEYILDGNEWDYEWRACEVPASAFAHIVGTDWETFFAKLCPDEPREKEAERVAQIEQWMDTGGSLETHPLIILLDPATGKFNVLDGWHRLGIAILKRGLTVILAVVAVEELATS